MKIKNLSKEEHEAYAIKQRGKTKTALHRTATNFNPLSRKEANPFPHS